MMAVAARTGRKLANEGIAQNVAALLTIQFFRKILPLITIPYLARVLGPEGFGLLAIFQSAAFCMILLIEFGFQLSATRSVARCRESLDQVAAVFAGVLGAQALLGLGSAIVVTFFISYVPVARAHPAMVAACLVWAIAEGSIPVWYFLGLERMKTVATLEICSKTVAAITILVLVHSAAGVGIVIGIQAVTAVLSLVAALLIARRAFPFRTPSAVHIREALTASWPMFVMRSAESLYTLANAFMLGLFAGPAIVAYFAGPEKISRALAGLFNPLRDALYPRISKLVHSSPADAVRLARVGIIVSSAGGFALGAIVYLFAPVLVSIVLGPHFEPAIPVLRLLALLPPMVALSQSIGMQWLLPLGREKVVTRTIVFAGILNVVLMFVFVPTHAHVGMAWAVICSEAFVCIRIVYAAAAERDPKMMLHARGAVSKVAASAP